MLFTTYVIRIRRHVPLSTAKTISNALINSRLDYFNSLINNIAKQDLSKLQRVQNCLARVVLRAPRFSPPPLPLLKQLNRIPVNYIIKFNSTFPASVLLPSSSLPSPYPLKLPLLGGWGLGV